MLAGGGFRGGRVVGASDATGERVASRPVYPRDLIASILLRLGIDPAGTITGPSGAPVRLGRDRRPPRLRHLTETGRIP
jgi:hypothetical protein